MYSTATGGNQRVALVHCFILAIVAKKYFVYYIDFWAFKPNTDF